MKSNIVTSFLKEKEPRKSSEKEGQKAKQGLVLWASGFLSGAWAWDRKAQEELSWGGPGAHGRPAGWLSDKVHGLRCPWIDDTRVLRRKIICQCELGILEPVSHFLEFRDDSEGINCLYFKKEFWQMQKNKVADLPNFEMNSNMVCEPLEVVKNLVY